MAGPRAHAQWRATLHDGGTRTAHRDCKNQSCESRSLHLNECRGGGGAGPWRTLNLTASRAISSAGRAPPRQGGGHWFEPSIAHRTPRIAQDCTAPQLQCFYGAGASPCRAVQRANQTQIRTQVCGASGFCFTTRTRSVMTGRRAPRRGPAGNAHRLRPNNRVGRLSASAKAQARLVAARRCVCGRSHEGDSAAAHSGATRFRGSPLIVTVSTSVNWRPPPGH